MGLTISTVEVPLLTVYATTLALLQLFRPRKSLSGECSQPAIASAIWDEEWDMDSIKPGKAIVIEGSTKDGQSIYIEIITHDNYNSATVVLGDSEKTIGGQFTGALVDNRTIKCGPLFVEMREPFRRWRVTFKGYLNNETDRNFVTIAGWWKPTSDARYFYSDLDYSGVRFTKTFDAHGNIEKLSKTHFSDDLSHFGQLYAEVCIDEIPLELRFRGVRQVSSYSAVQATDELHVYMEDGNRVSYKSVSRDGHSVRIHHGYMEQANLRSTSLSLPDEESLSLDNHRTINFHPANCSTLFGTLPYTLRKGSVSSFYSFHSSTGHLVEVRRVKVNSPLSTGNALIRTVRESLVKVLHPEFHSFGDVTTSAYARTRLVVPFSLTSCQDKEFTGGKGANLAKLKSVEKKYTVPNGAVVTTTAFNCFLDDNENIKNLVKQLSTTGLPLEEYIMQGEL